MIQQNSTGKIINILGLAICVSMLGDLALFAALPVKGQILGISLAQVGILLGIHRLIRIPGNAIGAVFINRSRRKPFFLAGMGLAVLSTAGYYTTNDFFIQLSLLLKVEVLPCGRHGTGSLLRHRNRTGII